MTQYISPQYIWQYKQDHTIIDVRSPSEFSSGHIPGAVNLPLFTDEERKIIGTTYKQVSPEKALMKGLDLVGPKMSGFLKQVKQLNCSKFIVHCSRGGKRSKSMAWLLSFGGFEIKVLEGGYKAYRHYVLDSFLNSHLSLIVLGGKTGMNKSKILRELEKKGEQIIDLERIANHKGSAFGRLGENPQPTVEQFENDLLECFLHLDTKKNVWVENESKSIGSVYIPLGLWLQMKSAPLINIEINADIRMKTLIEDYGKYEKEDIKNCFRNIEKRIGGTECKEALKYIDEGRLDKAAEIALVYYDKTYSYNLESKKNINVNRLHLNGKDEQQNAQILLDYVKRNLY